MSKPATQSITAAPSTTGGQATSAANRHPGRQRGQRQGRPQPEMRQQREPLGIAVAEQKRQHRQRGGQRNPVARQEQERAGHETQRAADGERATLAELSTAGRQVPHPRPRVQRVQPPVGQAVEGHRRAAGGDHADQDAQQVQPAERHRRRLGVGRPRHRRRQQRKRQRKQRVAEADQFQVLAEAESMGRSQKSECRQMERTQDQSRGQTLGTATSAIGISSLRLVSNLAVEFAILPSSSPTAGSARWRCPTGRRSGRRRNPPGRRSA